MFCTLGCSGGCVLFGRQEEKKKQGAPPAFHLTPGFFESSPLPQPGSSEQVGPTQPKPSAPEKTQHRRMAQWHEAASRRSASAAPGSTASPADCLLAVEEEQRGTELGDESLNDWMKLGFLLWVHNERPAWTLIQSSTEIGSLSVEAHLELFPPTVGPEYSTDCHYSAETD